MRRTLPALQRGAYRTLHASGMTYAFERALEDARVVTVINADTKAVSVTVEPGEYRDAMTGETLRVESRLTLEPRSGRVLVKG